MSLSSSSQRPHPPPNTITLGIKVLQFEFGNTNTEFITESRRARKEFQYALVRGWGAKVEELPIRAHQGKLHLECKSITSPIFNSISTRKSPENYQ